MPRHHADCLENLANVLNAAGQMIHTAQILYVRGDGRLDPEVVDGLEALQSDMGRYLAHFEDGWGWGSVNAEALMAMRHYEQIATDLLEEALYQ